MTLQDQIKGAWATLFEVYLAARKFNCIIHLFHVENIENGRDLGHYCFKPDPHRRIQGSKTPPSIFLRYCEREDGNSHLHFEWYRLSPKISRASNLFAALQNWLKQEDVRPITYDQLGKDEAEFKRKCSELLLNAKKNESRGDLQDALKNPKVVCSRTSPAIFLVRQSV
jgi:hypothetical protein